MANSNVRECVEGTQFQGAGEELVYAYDTAAKGTPTSPDVTVYDLDIAVTDVTSTVMPTGTPSVGGTVITLPALKSLTAGKRYRVVVEFTISGNIYQDYFDVVAQI